MFKAFLCVLTLIAVSSCANLSKPKYQYATALEYSKSKEFLPGKLVVIQGPTSDTEANINILSPRLKNYKYLVTDAAGKNYAVEHYDTVKQEALHWKIDKIHVVGLQPNTTYTLSVADEFRSSTTIVDKRTFQTLDIAKNNVKFAYASCMADDFRFNEIIDPMWEQMRKQNPDMVVLNGDVVYVDSFEFVERQKATELDIWFRFIDSFNRLPIYKWHHLKPILATWDDHDFGTNDGDRNFKGKEAARKIFLGFFGGKNIANVYQLEKDNVYFSLTAFGQRMVFLDDRYYRQPNKEQKVSEKYSHWGEAQHNWLFSKLNADKTPTWMFNGNQFFSGVDLSYKESLQSNGPEHFKLLLEELKKVHAPVVFASGDIHFSEIMKIPADRIGYETYEVTSSSMHSYTGTGWDNTLRLNGAFTREFNFMMVTSEKLADGLNIGVESWGIDSKPYFKSQFKVVKP